MPTQLLTATGAAKLGIASRATIQRKTADGTIKPVAVTERGVPLYSNGGLIALCVPFSANVDGKKCGSDEDETPAINTAQLAAELRAKIADREATIAMMKQNHAELLASMEQAHAANMASRSAVSAHEGKRSALEAKFAAITAELNAQLFAKDKEISASLAAKDAEIAAAKNGSWEKLGVLRDPFHEAAFAKDDSAPEAKTDAERWAVYAELEQTSPEAAKRYKARHLSRQ